MIHFVSNLFVFIDFRLNFLKNASFFPQIFIFNQCNSLRKTWKLFHKLSFFQYEFWIANLRCDWNELLNPKSMQICWNSSINSVNLFIEAAILSMGTLNSLILCQHKLHSMESVYWQSINCKAKRTECCWLYNLMQRKCRQTCIRANHFNFYSFIYLCMYCCTLYISNCLHIVH